VAERLQNPFAIKEPLSHLHVCGFADRLSTGALFFHNIILSFPFSLPQCYSHPRQPFIILILVILPTKSQILTDSSGRHECGERCCPGEKKATERQASKRKHRPLNAGPVIENIEAEHICLKVCGRPLKCGNHNCTELCHKGPCHSCLEAVFEEISCNCGRTVLQPPQPCGSKAPACSFDCTRPRACGHPRTKHNCHEDDEPCAKCSYLVEKHCICGKRTLKNQPCWFSEVRCGLPCGKKLKCGNHFCQKECHRPGQCEDPCTQLCGRKKTVCDHTCTDPCHA
jgi:transcriptional repressor NF-X1